MRKLITRQETKFGVAFRVRTEGEALNNTERAVYYSEHPTFSNKGELAGYIKRQLDIGLYNMHFHKIPS